MTNRFQKFTFSVNSTRPHETNTVAFSNLSDSGKCFQKFAFSWKTKHRKHNKMLKTHSCGRGLTLVETVSCERCVSYVKQNLICRMNSALSVVMSN